MLTFTTKLTVQAGQEQTFERMMCIAVPKVREEPGNHVYIFHRSTQDPRIFMLYEEYDDQAAWTRIARTCARWALTCGRCWMGHR